MNKLIEENGAMTRSGMRALAIGQLLKFVSDTHSMCGVDYPTLVELRATVVALIEKIQSETE